jgi:C-terminal processing protease CtpA/Prc
MRVMQTLRHIIASSLLLWAAILPSWGEDAPTIPSAIERLGAETFADRESAQRALLDTAQKQADPVLKACAAAYRQTQDPEVRHRLKAVMQHVVETIVFRAPRGFLGIQMNHFQLQEFGNNQVLVINNPAIPSPFIRVSSVIENTGAAKAGLQANDMIVAVDGKTWERQNSAWFTAYIQSKSPGTQVNLTFLRDGKTNQVAAVLGETPEADREAMLAPERARPFFDHWWRENVETGQTAK